MDPRSARSVYNRLLATYGPQGWWPAETAFEVIVGAVLTQNTAWTNVEYALANLDQAGIRTAEDIVALERVRLGELIRPSGYFNIKAVRLQAVCRFLIEHGGIEALDTLATDDLRSRLLAVHGVGPETADDIVLYAFERPVFVIDAYTRRIFARLGLIEGREGYERLRHEFERAFGADVPVFREYHGLIVRHAKEACRVRPDCAVCCLRRRCPVGRGTVLHTGTGASTGL